MAHAYSPRKARFLAKLVTQAALVWVLRPGGQFAPHLLRNLLPCFQGDGVFVMNPLTDWLSQHIEAANVLVVVGRIEDGLEKLLLAAGRPISNAHAKRLFGRGPLQNFGPKIEIAYFFELITEPVFKDLMIIKDVRNIFAHTTTYVYFSTEEVANKCTQMTTWKKGADPQDVFYRRTLEISDLLAAELSKIIWEKALKEEPTIVFGEKD